MKRSRLESTTPKRREDAICEQIDELRGLRDGWHDGQGKRLSRSGLEWLAEALTEWYPGTATLPYLFPTDDGNVYAEWSIGLWMPSVFVQLMNRTGQWHLCHQVSEIEESKEIDLLERYGWWHLGQSIEILSAVCGI